MCSKTAYAAVRLDTDSGREWLDAASVNLLAEQVQTHVGILRDKIPSWDRANPVVRIVHVAITELAD